jgi:hypothetical protein
MKGLPGQNGGAGGNFFGIGQTFLNEQGLTITANGGNGSSGQEGGDGLNGIDGVNPEKHVDLNQPVVIVPPLSYLLDVLGPQSNSLHSYQDYLIENFLNSKSDTFQSVEKLPYAGGPISNAAGMVSIVSYWLLKGKKATAGSNGESGGVSGFGGVNGEIKLFSFDEVVKIKTINRPGQDGISDVRGGIGGVGGKHGNHLTIKVEERNSHFSSTISNISYQGSASNGMNGTSGRIGEKCIVQVPFESPQKLIEDYRKFASNQESNKFIDRIKQNFLTSLNSEMQ